MKSNLHVLDETGRKNKHTIFVDSKKELEEFSAAKYFDTVPDLTERAYNRPRLSQLRNGTLGGGGVKAAMKARDASYRKLTLAIEREEKLRNALEHMQTQKNLRSKGRREKVKDAKGGAPAVYKWRQERKR